MTLAHVWTASTIAYVFFCPLGIPREQCFLNPVAIDLCLIHYICPPFHGKPSDLLGGRHLKSLSENWGASGPPVHCALISPKSEPEAGNRGRTKLPKLSVAT